MLGLLGVASLSEEGSKVKSSREVNGGSAHNLGVMDEVEDVVSEVGVQFDGALLVPETHRMHIPRQVTQFEQLEPQWWWGSSEWCH